jgi:acyl carrier protein
MDQASQWNAIQAAGSAERASQQPPRAFGASFVAGGHDFLVNATAHVYAAVVQQLRPLAGLGSLFGGEGPTAGGADAGRKLLYGVRWVAAPRVRGGGPPRSAAVASSGTTTTTNPEPAGPLAPFRLVSMVAAPRYGDCGAVTLDAAHAAADHAAIASAAEGGRPGLVVMAGLEPTPALVEQAGVEFLGLLQRCVDAAVAGRLVLVLPGAADGAVLAGLSKAFALEHPDVVCQRIFYDGTEAGSLTAARVAALVGHGLAHHGETDLWVRAPAAATRSRKFKRRKDAVLVQRLEPYPLRQPAAAAAAGSGGEDEDEGDDALLSDDPNDAYLITGGTGGIGRSLIEWLLTEHKVAPAQLVVLSRSRTSAAAAALAALGVRIIEADVGDPGGLAANMELAALSCRVAGVFHLAGVLDDGLVSNLTADRLAAVVAPKAAGLLALLAIGQTAEWELDFVVAFSSTSSLFGYPGQANYCAANAVLDQLACWGGGNGSCLDDETRFIAINWGPWGEAGMAAAGSKAYESALRDGDTPLQTAEALLALGTILAGRNEMPLRSSEFAVCDVQWQKSPWKDLPIITALLEATPTTTTTGGGGGKPTTAASAASGGGGTASSASVSDEGLPESPPNPVTSAVVELLRSTVSQWNVGQSLTALGMDSLDLVQLRNSFNRKFAVKVPLSVFTKPNRTLHDLVSELELALAQ